MIDLRIVWALALLVAGCGLLTPEDPHAKQVDDEANRDLAGVKIDQEHDVVKLRCPGGADLAPGCGLLFAHVATPEFREKFRARKCTGKTDDECQALYQHEVDAALRERYWAADRQAIAKRCDEEQGRCDDPLVLEKDLLTSHNTNVLVRGAQRQAAIESAREAAHRADQAAANARTNAVINDVLFDLTGPQCRTNYAILTGKPYKVCTGPMPVGAP